MISSDRKRRVDNKYRGEICCWCYILKITIIVVSVHWRQDGLSRRHKVLFNSSNSSKLLTEPAGSNREGGGSGTGGGSLQTRLEQHQVLRYLLVQVKKGQEDQDHLFLVPGSSRCDSIVQRRSSDVRFAPEKDTSTVAL